MKTHRWSILSSIGILFLLMGLPFSTVQAACPLPSTASISLGANTCTVADVTGVDVTAVENTTNTGILTLDDANSLITINNGGQLFLGSLVVNLGTMSIQTGGFAKLNTPLYVTDADSDGYPANLSLFSTTLTGRRRFGLMTSISTLDCDDGNVSVYANAICYADADQDTYTSGGAQSVCGTVSACNGTTWKAAANGADCNDSDALVYIAIPAGCHKDNDQDSSTAGISGNSYCTNNATCESVTRGGPTGDGQLSYAFTAGQFKTSALNITDCCDTDSRAYPGGACQTTINACGVWDFDCDGVLSEHCYDDSTYSCTSPCSGCAASANVTSGGWVSGAPSCGNSSNRNMVDESHQGNTCYDNVTCADISNGAYGATMTCK